MGSRQVENDLAERYAAALFELAHEKKTLSDVSAVLVGLRGAIESHGDFEAVLKNPTLPRHEVTNAVLEVAALLKLTHP